MIKVILNIILISIVCVLCVITYNLWSQQQALAYAFVEFRKPGDRFTAQMGREQATRIEDQNQRLKYLEGFIDSCKKRRGGNPCP